MTDLKRLLEKLADDAVLALVNATYSPDKWRQGRQDSEVIAFIRSLSHEQIEELLSDIAENENMWTLNIPSLWKSSEPSS